MGEDAEMKVSIIILFGIMLILPGSFVLAEKRECKDLVSEEKYSSEGHDDNKESNKEFKESLEEDSLCEFTKKHDHEKLDGTVKDYIDFKETRVHNTSTIEQKECLNEGHDSPDKGEKALQGYEIEYCGWDDD